MVNATTCSFAKRRSRAISNGTIVHSSAVGAVQCRACAEYVIPLRKSQVTCAHQDPCVSKGFSMFRIVLVCPFCDERGL